MDHELVDEIYEAAAVPDRWPRVLDKLGKMVGGLGATLLVPSAGRWVASPGVASIVEEFVSSGLAANNERTRRLLAFNHPGFITDLDVFTMEEIATSPIHRDFFTARGGGLGVATIIPSPSGDTMVIHAERRLADGPIESEHVRLLDGLRPHLARAALFSSRLQLERVRAAVVALERVGLPAAVLDRRHRAIAANSLLEELMPDMLQDRPSRLALANTAADRLFAEALEHVGPGAVGSVPVPAEGVHPPAIVHLIPVRGAASDVFGNASAIVVVTPVVPREVPNAEVLQGLFDLTPAEAKVARAVGNGATLANAAHDLGLRQETVRSQMKSVLAKTGLHRQADLIGLLRGVTLSSHGGPISDRSRH